MATIDSIEVIKQILENNGYYPGDPQVLAVHSYINQAGNKAYHVSWHESDIASMMTSRFIQCYKLLWSRQGLTPDGELELYEMRGK